MAGLGAKDILRNVTALEQLIEEINFQRAKEMRQCLMSKDSDTGFVMVQGTTYWTDLFVRHFLFQTDRSTDADDLLFFIRKKQLKGSRYIPKYQTEVEVYRRDSRKLPIGDPDVDWEETVYLNLIIHQFDYTLTLAVCTRTSPKDLQVLRRHSQKVYASPSRRRMDTKGEVEEITYPSVCFHVDNFDEVFADMLVRDGEMVCVELVASDHAGTRQAVIFLGSIRYDALKRVYDARASLSSKVAQRMMMGLFASNTNQRIEFVRMKGPQGKGHAEMAVTKPKGSGVETPTSEPGVSLTDMWDCDWEDEPEDRFIYRHQRRLSDPSANFNTFINAGWKSRPEGARSRSENEGLDYFADGLYEIESGDVRDAVCSGRCCSVVACNTVREEEEECPPQEVQCIKCHHFHGVQPMGGARQQSPSPPASPGETSPLLSTSPVPPPPPLLTQCHPDNPEEENEAIILVQTASECLSAVPEDSATCSTQLNKEQWNTEYQATAETSFISSNIQQQISQANQSSQHPVLTPEVASSSPATPPQPRAHTAPHDHSSTLPLVRLRSKKPGTAQRVQSVPVIPQDTAGRETELCGDRLHHSCVAEICPTTTQDEDSGDEARMCGSCEAERPHHTDLMQTHSSDHTISTLQSPARDFSTLHDPCAEEKNDPTSTADRHSGTHQAHSSSHRTPTMQKSALADCQSAGEGTSESATESLAALNLSPARKKRPKVSVPYKMTPDGTKVNFLCDLQLDDGAYNPLWTTKGFTQTFHFWKESRRAQSVPLNAYLTYVTLPWFTIITDILDHRTGPILTF